MAECAMLYKKGKKGTRVQNIPVFTTEYGAASLILKEIPYRKEAYIRIQDSKEPEKLLQACADFCRNCGAEKIYAAGHPVAEQYPLHCAVWEYRGTPVFHPEEMGSLFPVTEQTAEKWRRVYNEKMQSIHNAATLEWTDRKRLLEGTAYFVHENGNPLGIFWLEGESLLAIASLCPGGGWRSFQSMLSIAPETLRLEVASTNTKAIALYERAGLIRTKELSRWYAVEK